MPQPSKLSTTMSEARPRRSARISNRQAQDVSTDPRQPPTKKRKATEKDALVAGSPPCATGCAERPSVIARRTVLSKADFRRASRMSASELDRREGDLLSREEDCRIRVQQIDERMRALLNREDEAAATLSRLAKQEAHNALDQLEEHFTCVLCHEIMAYPYSLHPGRCGHTFCAICILRWFFSRLHRACGGWHEAVDCPICRSVLILTPDRVPRSNMTFPFVPNRVAAAVVESLIERLATSSLPVVKRECSEALRISESDKQGCKRKKEVAKLEDSDVDLDDWKKEGTMRAEWLKRDRDGKREMNQLLHSWPTLGSNDFLLLKQRLQV